MVLTEGIRRFCAISTRFALATVRTPPKRLRAKQPLRASSLVLAALAELPLRADKPPDISIVGAIATCAAVLTLLILQTLGTNTALLTAAGAFSTLALCMIAAVVSERTQCLLGIVVPPIAFPRLVVPRLVVSRVVPRLVIPGVAVSRVAIRVTVRVTVRVTPLTPRPRSYPLPCRHQARSRCRPNRRNPGGRAPRDRTTGHPRS